MSFPTRHTPVLSDSFVYLEILDIKWGNSTKTMYHCPVFFNFSTVSHFLPLPGGAGFTHFSLYPPFLSVFLVISYICSLSPGQQHFIFTYIPQSTESCEDSLKDTFLNKESEKGCIYLSY